MIVIIKEHNIGLQIKFAFTNSKVFVTFCYIQNISEIKQKHTLNKFFEIMQNVQISMIYLR